MNKQEFLDKNPDIQPFARTHPIRFGVIYLLGRIMAKLRLLPKTIQIHKLRFENWRLNRKLKRLKRRLAVQAQTEPRL